MTRSVVDIPFQHKLLLCQREMQSVKKISLASRQMRNKSCPKCFACWNNKTLNVRKRPIFHRALLTVFTNGCQICVWLSTVFSCWTGWPHPYFLWDMLWEGGSICFIVRFAIWTQSFSQTHSVFDFCKCIVAVILLFRSECSFLFHSTEKITLSVHLCQTCNEMGWAAKWPCHTAAFY